MHLTRLRLDPRNAQARRDLADPYEMHRTLVRAFVEDSRHHPPRLLWRLEPGQLWTQPVVLLQSATAGDWGFLLANAGYLQPDEDALAVKQIDPGAMLQPDQRLRFRLAANPTVTRGGKRHGLVGEQDQLAWLARQGERLGYALEAALVTGSDMVHARKGGMRLSLRRVLYEGVLSVRDPEAMTPALVSGIGHGKALGCGLLSLARAS